MDCGPLSQLWPPRHTGTSRARSLQHSRDHLSSLVCTRSPAGQVVKVKQLRRSNSYVGQTVMQVKQLRGSNSYVGQTDFYFLICKIRK